MPSGRRKSHIHAAHVCGEFGIVNGDDHAALRPAGVCGVYARIDDAIEVLEGNLLRSVFSDRATCLNVVERIHGRFLFGSF